MALSAIVLPSSDHVSIQHWRHIPRHPSDHPASNKTHVRDVHSCTGRLTNEGWEMTKNALNSPVLSRRRSLSLYSVMHKGPCYLLR